MQCPNCHRVYPISDTGVIDFQAVDKILSLPEPYTGLWALTQHRSMDQYRSLDPASISTSDRADVQAFAQFMDLNGLDVLDIGAGCDYLPGYIQDKQMRHYVAIDPLSPQKKGDHLYVMAWGELIPFKNESFDALILATSLDHILCLDSLFMEMNRVLKPGGSVYLWGGLYYEESELINMPPEPLFKRRSEDKLDEATARQRQAEDRRRLIELCDDVSGLEKRYSHQLADQYHVRHITVPFLKSFPERYGFIMTAAERWEVREHYVYCFVKLQKTTEKADSTGRSLGGYKGAASPLSAAAGETVPGVDGAVSGASEYLESRLATWELEMAELAANINRLQNNLQANYEVNQSGFLAKFEKAASELSQELLAQQKRIDELRARTERLEETHREISRRLERSLLFRVCRFVERWLGRER